MEPRTTELAMVPAGGRGLLGGMEGERDTGVLPMYLRLEQTSWEAGGIGSCDPVSWVKEDLMCLSLEQFYVRKTKLCDSHSFLLHGIIHKSITFPNVPPLSSLLMHSLTIFAFYCLLKLIIYH